MRRALLTSAARALGPALSVALGVVLAGGAAAGEPQILGVIATAEPVPMTCDDNGCMAELSAFCLQRHKAVPFPRTAYVPAPGSEDGFAFVATDAAGARVPYAVGGGLTFLSERGNRAVTLHVDRSRLAAAGLTDPVVGVGTRVSLLPQSLAEQLDDPGVAAEVALVTGPLRAVAQHHVDRGGPAIEAAHLINRRINRSVDVRSDEAAPTGTPSGAARDGGVSTDDGTANGVALARAAVARCTDLPGGGFITFRQCLSAQHDMLIDPLNRAYWRAVDPGS